MKFNKKEINKFIEYYKYFIILRNIVSNYYKTNIKNIKLESIKINYINDSETNIEILFIINNILSVVIELICINNRLDIKKLGALGLKDQGALGLKDQGALGLKDQEYIYAKNSIFKEEYEFNYDLINKNINPNFRIIKQMKYFYLALNIYEHKKYIIYKIFLLKNLNIIKLKYYYIYNKYKIYIIYTSYNSILLYNIYNNNRYRYNIYSYILKIYI